MPLFNPSSGGGSVDPVTTNVTVATDLAKSVGDYNKRFLSAYAQYIAAAYLDFTTDDGLTQTGGFYGNNTTFDADVALDGSYISAGSGKTHSLVFKAAKSLKLDAVNGIFLTTSGSRPAASVTYRGMIWFTQGGGGVADSLTICMKDAGGSYSWVAL